MACKCAAENDFAFWCLDEVLNVITSKRQRISCETYGW